MKEYVTSSMYMKDVLCTHIKSVNKVCGIASVLEMYYYVYCIL